MTSPSRRRFLSGSALTIAALTGSVAADTDPRERPAGRGGSSTSPAEAIAALPPANAVERTYRSVIVETVDVDSADELTHTARSTAEALDVDPTALSTVASVFTADYDRRLGTARGSFDAPTDDDAATAVDDWRVDDDGTLAVASTDGHAAFAGGEDEAARVDTATTMAEVAVGDAPRFGEETAGVATAFDALDSMQTVLFVPDPSDANISNTASGELRALAAGFSVHPSELTGSGETEYYLFPTADAALDEDLVRAIVADVEPNEVVDTDVSTVDDAIRVRATVEAAPDYDREAAPDAHVRTSFDRETTTMTFTHRGGEAIPADELELWVDGELADTQPADQGDAFTEGDALTVDTGPLAVVGLRWFDEPANVYYTYASETVDREAFEGTVDTDAGTATFRYVGQHDADPSNLTVSHNQDDGVRTIEDAFADAGDTLTDGDEVVVEGVSFGDSVRLELAVPDVTGLNARPLAHVRVSPPRLHVSTHPEQGTVLRYHGSTERDADEFRLLVDGEPADTQLAEKTETLSRGDTVAVGEFPLGSELTVEWVEPEESMVVAEHVVTPRTHVSVTYDADDGTATFTHRDGQSLPAEDLEVRVDRKATETQPRDEFDTFGSGDEFAVDVPPFASVELVWVGEDVESRVGGTTTGRDAIEASYDPDAEELELVYVGEQPADPARLHVRRRASGGGGEDGDTTAFAAAYDELTDGDSVTVDAGVDDRVALTVRTETENTTSVRSIAHFSMTPRHAFGFQRDDGSLIATYRDAVDRDADEFRVLVDGEPVDEQPGDVHDTLTWEATVDLGDVPVGKTVTVEWTAVDDAVEVGEHTVAPSAAFDVSYDAAEDALTVEHAGGDTVDADDLSVVAPPSIERPTDWTGEGEVAEGDAATFEVTETPEMVYVVFAERELLDREQVDDDGEREHAVPE
ncbi:type IV pilin N-terminal domain-containing protein [Halorubellus sp. PRR65]|uniref:type IV pilin N-terminal domain-containing protein n=1 Tax=Halorubellus sp. PRR65 TaxID=3098148 RepID=UPI002B25A3F1|nr:type IV pilin N-terminal domain-containing protein [Halorubellus sp. PRR65]